MMYDQYIFDSEEAVESYDIVQSMLYVATDIPDNEHAV